MLDEVPLLGEQFLFRNEVRGRSIMADAQASGKFGEERQVAERIRVTCSRARMTAVAVAAMAGTESMSFGSA